MEVLKRLKHKVQRVWPDIADYWRLHHDNVPTQIILIVSDYLVKSGVPTIPQFPYTLVAPSDFFLFTRLKTPMKGKHFGTVNRITRACTVALKDILEEAYRKAFET